MKKLYKQFTKLNIEMDIQPMEVSDLEKERVKRAVVKGKKKNHFSRNMSVAVAFFVASSITLSFTFPTFAAKLPVIGNIFELFIDDEKYVFEKYDTYSTEIGVTKESNGISVTVTDAVYDGENITVAYTIKSEQDLGERPVLMGEWVVDEFKNMYKDSGYFDNYVIEKINDNEYAVLYIYELIDGPKPDEVHITWQGNKILNLINVNNTFHGDWSFQFSLNALESETQKFADSIKSEEEDIGVVVTKMTETPISTTLYLSEFADVRKIAKEDEEWRGVLIEYLVSDNLGNEYKTIHYNGTGHSTDFKNHVNYSRITTTVFHEEATTLTITPIVGVYKMIDNNGSLELVKEPYTIETIQLPLNK
ncbi:DUF4179 domain-containing protein [Paenisporosarcina sp.]|uniref:DUF4179 domain-containing protein n=1 Tax=Paenisporosarcina sp. TaxID=1932001 RepID=UPI003C77B90F